MESMLEYLPQDTLDPRFINQVMAYPGTEDVRKCIQCGTCSGSCQMSRDMDYTPRQIMAMIRAGMKQEVLESQAIWYCASCYSCTARCPSGINIAEVMFALKSIALAEGYCSLKSKSPAFYQSFYEVVGRYGRMHEASLIVSLAMKTHPFQYVNMAPFGFNMFRKGKIEVLPKRLKTITEIRKLAEVAHSMEVN